MKTPVHKEAASIVNHLRVEALIREVSKSEIGRQTHRSRQTVYKKLKGTDMKLSDFLDISKAIHADPVTILKKGIEEGDIT